VSDEELTRDRRFDVLTLKIEELVQLIRTDVVGQLGHIRDEAKLDRAQIVDLTRQTAELKYDVYKHGRELAGMKQQLAALEAERPKKKPARKARR